MNLDALNQLSPEKAAAEFLRCCGSSKWAEAMAAGRPYPDREALLDAAEDAWRRIGVLDQLEAFSQHPRIGDREELKAKFAATADWAKGEQSGVRGASEAVLGGLAAGNREYEDKFGFVFLVCATGKSAEELLGLLRARLANGRDAEIRIAAAEQAKITRLRLEKLLNQGGT